MPRISFLLPLLLVTAWARAEEHAPPSEAPAEAEAPADEHTPDDLVNRAAKQGSRDVKLPRPLVKQIEESYREYLKAHKLPDTGALPRKLLNVSVELRQDRPAALHENVRINTPLGGGVIDLADFVTPLRGRFSLKIKALQEDKKEPGNMRVFFVSRAKERIVGGEKFGAGCGRFMEVSSYFQQKMAGHGLDLFTADQRYGSVLGGTFLLVDFSATALQVAGLTFTDSRFLDLFCE